MDALRFRAADTGLDGSRDAIHRGIDLVQAFRAFLDRKVSQVDIDRQPRQVPVKEIDRRPAFEREDFFARDMRQDAHQERNLGFIGLTRHCRPPVSRNLPAP